MTKTLLTIALAAATMGFAAPQATTPAPKTDNAPAASQTPKKHAKKTSKSKKQSTSNATSSKPAAK
jgi:hypothetical protein